jgi:hypothetical protein
VVLLGTEFHSYVASVGRRPLACYDGRPGMCSMPTARRAAE